MPSTKIDGLTTKDDVYLECYDFGHSWARLGYFNWNGSNGICRRYYCSRCSTERDDYFRRVHTSGQWSFYGRRYFYPDGYLKEGTGRVTKKDIHNEVIRRVIGNNEILSDDQWELSPPAMAVL